MCINVVCIFNYSVQGGKLLINTHTNCRLGNKLSSASVGKIATLFKEDSRTLPVSGDTDSFLSVERT